MFFTVTNTMSSLKVAKANNNTILTLSQISANSKITTQSHKTNPKTPLPPQQPSWQKQLP